MVDYHTWQAEPEVIYQEPDFDFVKDPSVFQAKDGRYYMFYTGSAFGFQGDSPPPWRIDYASSADGVRWKKEGTAFIADDAGWELGRVQAPTKPVWHDGKYWMFYAGGPRLPENICMIGYATSIDLKVWQKNPDFVISHLNGSVNKANDPFVYRENDLYYMFYTTYPNEEVFFRTSADLTTWSEPRKTGAWGEGALIWKERGAYYLISAVGYSGRGEKYHLFSSLSLESFEHHGPLEMNIPCFATSAWGHGDILMHEGIIYLYFQGTKDGGRTFQIGRARPVK